MNPIVTRRRSFAPVDFEGLWKVLADKAMIQRKRLNASPELPPTRTSTPAKVRGENKHREHWTRIVAAMGRGWLTVDEIAMKAKLFPRQVRRQFQYSREKLETRGTQKPGFQWRLK